MYEDKSLLLRARDMIFTNDLQTVNYYSTITAWADLFLKECDVMTSILMQRKRWQNIDVFKSKNAIFK